MNISGTIIKDGKHYLASIPALDALTQGTSKTNAMAMAVAWVRDILDRPDLPLVATATQDGFRLTTTEPAPIIALMLRRQRAAAGLSLADVAARLGSTSRNTYARYEQGRSVPTIDQLDRLLASVNPDRGGVALTC